MTLNLRAPSNAQQFRSHVGHLRVGGFGLHEAEHVGQDLVGMASILAHAGHRQVRELDFKDPLSGRCNVTLKIPITGDMLIELRF